jgi:lincosamide and streptogramin A transport system ATP-binding/permease protein
MESAAMQKEQLLKNVERNDTLRVSPLRHHAELLIEARGLTVAYGERTVCGPLDFTLRQGECLALCGRNGSGKSSIIKLLMGENVPHTGTLRTASGLIVSYMPQDTSFCAETCSTTRGRMAGRDAVFDDSAQARLSARPV